MNAHSPPDRQTIPVIPSRVIVAERRRRRPIIGQSPVPPHLRQVVGAVDDRGRPRRTTAVLVLAETGTGK